MASTILEMQNITKLFPGVKALDNVSVKVEEGEIHDLVGENGAGKSTLMNILSGIYPYGTYEGKIIFQGKECRFKSIRDSERKGIVIIHQEFALIPLLSIAENMYLGNERAKSKVIDWNRTHNDANENIKKVGLSEDSSMLIKDISVGKQCKHKCKKRRGSWFFRYHGSREDRVCHECIWQILWQRYNRYYHKRWQRNSA